MDKKNFMTSKGGAKKFVVTTVAAAAFTLPLAFATPSVAIARADVAVNTVATQQKTANKKPSQKPDKTKMKEAQKAFDAAKDDFLKLQEEYNKIVDQVQATQNPAELEAEQQAEIDALNAELEAMISDINDINTNITKINTDNQEKLAKVVAEFNDLKQKADDANQKMIDAQSRVDQNKTAYDTKHAASKQKVDDAVKVMNEKEADFNAFKATYDAETAKFTESKAQYDKKLSDVKSQISDLETQIAMLPKKGQAGYKEANEKAASLQKQVDALNEEYASLDKQAKGFEASRNELVKKHDALYSSYKDAQAHVDALNAEVDELNKHIDTDNASLNKEYEAAKAAYDRAVEKKTAFEATVAEQKKLAEAENKKNADIYADTQAKFDAYNEKVARFNSERDNLSTDIQAIKDKVEAAYNNLKTSFDTAKDAQDALSDAYKAYNKEVDKYNADLKADFEAKQAKYEQELAAHNAALKKMEENTKKEGQLSEVVIQTLKWGPATETKADKFMKDGSISWSNPNNVQSGKYFNFKKEPIAGKHNGWIGNAIKPGESATVTYTKKALRGLTVCGEKVQELKVTYTNESKYEQYVLASVNPQYGFWVRYPDPKNPKKLLGAPAQADPKKKIFQSTRVDMQFIGKDGKPIQFSEDKPVNIFLSSLNRGEDKKGRPNHVENISFNNFDKLIPINGSWVRTDIKLPGHDGDVIATYKATPSPKEWDNIAFEKFYIGAICGQKTSGDTVSFTASVYGNPRGGLNPWTAFFDSSKIIPLPPVPVPPEAPKYLQEKKFNQVDLLEPKTVTLDTYTPKHLDPHAPLPVLLKVEVPNVNIDTKLVTPNQPKHLMHLKKTADLPEPQNLEIVELEAPPTVPNVPATPETPKTADASSMALGGLLGMLGSAAIMASSKLKKKF